MLVYHTFFGEFSGADAQAVLAALHEDSRAGTGLDYPAWWAYQQKLWKRRYGLSIPDAAHPDGCRRLLEVLIEVGALIDGPRPAGAGITSPAP